MQEVQPPAKSFRDKIAWKITRFVRFFTHLFLKNRPLAQIITYEAMSSGLGMIGATLVHFRCIRTRKNGSNWINALVSEAENKRLHLLTLMTITNPNWFARTAILMLQAIFDLFYAMIYFLSSKTAHSFMSYLEEEMVERYSHCIEEIDGTELDNPPLPAFTKRHWALAEDAKLRDALLIFREDEIKHQTVNRQMATI